MPRLYSSAVNCIRLIEEDANLNRDVVTNAVLYNKSIIDEILRAKLTGITETVNRFFRYGESQTTGGLPRAYINNYSPIFDSDNDLLTFLNTMYPQATIIWNQSISRLASYTTTGSSLVGYDAVGVEWMTIHGNIGDNYEYISTTYNGGTSFTVHYTFQSIALQNKYVTFEKEGYSHEDSYYIVEFGDSIISGNTFLWAYRIGSGEFPLIDNSQSSVLSGTYLPVMPIRYDRTNAKDVPYLNEDLTKMLEFFSIDLDTFTQDVNNNPDIDSIVDVTVGFVVDIASQTQPAKKYWYMLAEQISNGLQLGSATYDAWMADSDNDDLVFNGRGSLSVHNFVQDPDADVPINSGGNGFVGGGFYNPPTNATWNPTLENIFSTQLSWNYMTVSTINGNIGDIGTYDTVFDISPTEITDLQITSTVSFRKQISATQYTEIFVHGLLHSTTGGKVGITSPIEAGDLTVYKLLSETDDYAFYSQMNKGILDLMSQNEREQLFYEGLRMIAYAEQSQHLPWYTVPSNRLALQILVFIVSIITWQPQLNAIYAAGWTYAAAVLIFEIVATNLLIKAAVDYLIEELGAENAAIALVAIAASAYFTGDITGLAEFFNAENLLFLVSTFTTGVQEWVNTEITDLIDEAEDFYKSAEEKQEELDDAQDLLGSSTINPFDIIDSNRYIFENETPDDFFNRTIHNSNPGVSVLNYTENFVAQALTLPDNVIR